MKALILLLVSLPSFAASEYVTKTEEWRKKEEESLRAPESWLSVVALDWLKDGATKFGTGEDNDLKLAKGSGPEHGGSFVMEGKKVFLEAGEGVTLNDQPAPKTRTELKTDGGGKPDKVRAGRVLITVVDRSGQLGLRVRDPESPNRKTFAGRKWYPVNEKYKVEAEFEAAANPRELVFENVIHQVLREKSPGYVKFTLKGKTYRLAALGDTKEGLFLIFRDGTSGKSTYGAGRFLDTEPFTGTKVTLDFNRATSPPCAFTHFATCPLPPKENVLEVAIEAGEKGKH